MKGSGRERGDEEQMKAKTGSAMTDMDCFVRGLIQSFMDSLIHSRIGSNAVIISIGCQ